MNAKEYIVFTFNKKFQSLGGGGVTLPSNLR